MNRFLLPLVLFVFLALVLGIGIKHAPEKGVVASALIGKPAPQFSLPSLSDPSRRVSSSELRGRWYLFNVWGTWCATCRQEHPLLLELQKTGMVSIVGLDWRDQDADATAWLAQLGNPYETVAVDRDGREAIDWGVMAAPESFLVNPQGIVVYKCPGELTREIFQREIVPRVTGKAVADSTL
jgi:cytochrome c biogenesis protein CcmG/thiol:disulfide interchange protein DsbE